MNNQLIISALSIKLEKLLSNYADLYFDILTDNEAEPVIGYEIGTRGKMERIEKNISIIYNEINRLNAEILEYDKNDDVNFKKLCEDVSMLSIKNKNEAIKLNNKDSGLDKCDILNNNDNMESEKTGFINNLFKKNK